MRACSKCFNAETWPVNIASGIGSSASHCSFGHGYSQQTWPVTGWKKPLSQLLDLYERVPNGGGEEGVQIATLLQEDWNIFQLDEQNILTFISHAVPEHDLLIGATGVQLKRGLIDANEDHVSSWNDFSEEIQYQYRYFPRVLPDEELLREAFLDRSVPITEDTELYRARISSKGDVLPADKMGPPPVADARPGRANPSGIPYLYLGMAKETCVYETRPGHLTEISIGTFRPTRSLKVLDLKTIEHPDFFDDEPGRRQIFFRYLRALSERLSRPVRSGDDPVEYVPTQYLCEFARSIGLDGVIYASALHRGGTNVVLFDETAVECSPDVDLAIVSEVELSWDFVS